MDKRLSRPRRTLELWSNEDQTEDLTEEQLLRLAFRQRIFNLIKMGVFLLIWLFFTILIMITPSKEHNEVMVPLKSQVEQTVKIDEEPTGDIVRIILKGNIDAIKTNLATSGNEPCIEVCIRQFNVLANETIWKSSDWKVFLAKDPDVTETVKHDFKLKYDKSLKYFGSAEILRKSWDTKYQLLVSLLNQYNDSTGLSMTIESNPLDTTQGIIYGSLLLIFLYTLIIFDITDRTFAAILTATAAIGVLSLMNSRPPFHTIIAWIDMETLMLLFGMMIMVGIISETGVFDYLSVYAYQLSRGKIWYLFFYLCMFTGFLSAFLDNVTMVLLMVPVTIRLSEILHLNTTLLLISMAIFSNIGGTLTPVGDPPNVIIATNHYVASHGIEFLNFTMHMFPGILIAMLLAFLMLYFMNRHKIVEYNEEGVLRSMKSLELQLNNNKTDELLKQTMRKRLEELTDRFKSKQAPTTTNFEATLADMKAKYKVKDKPLLIKCCICFGFAIAMFFLHSLPFMQGIKLCWAAILGAILLVILTNRADFDSILKSVEWSTLLFFAALFILMESLVEMGLIDLIGEVTIHMVMAVDKSYQLMLAILLIMWISAITSAFVDNIPITTMMLKVTIKLATNNQLSLPLSPLIWALSFGACFGGNGTLIGASANIVTAAIASQYGYTINFLKFFTIGFPIMVMTVFVSTIYLLIAHCAFHWHD